MPTIRNIGDLNFDKKKEVYYRIIDLGHRPNGNRWRVRVTAKTKQRLAAKVKAKLKELEDGTYQAGTTPTLNEWWEYWCDNIAYHRVRPRVLGNYRSYGRKHIPHIGKNRIDAITPEHVRHLHDKMRQTGASDRTIQAVHATLSKCLKDAVHEGKITINPCDRMDRPKANSKAREAYSQAEARAILTTMAGDSPMMRARWALALTMAVRQGECLGLEWDRVDLDRGLVDLSWQIQRIPWAHGEGCDCDSKTTAARCPKCGPDVPPGYECRPCHKGLWFVRPKTATSSRVLPMSNAFRAAMMELYRGQQSGLVFHADGKPILNRDDDAAWYELCERAGVRRMVLHTARHTVISHLLDAGVDAELIRQFAGHSTLLSTRGYLHSSEDAMRAALDKLAG